ncbi:MAG: helicase RepA family protein [Aeromonas sp.]
MLPAGQTCSIYGPSGAGKSFFAMSWACHIATGKPWDGRKVTQGTVIYIAAEGSEFLAKRARAWADEHNNGEQVEELMLIGQAVQLVTPQHVGRLIDNVLDEQDQGRKVALIVVDTLARCFGGGDENTAKDMGAFISGCDMLREQTGAGMLLVHHTGKDIDKGQRGSSSLRAAMDAEYLIKREQEGEASVILECKKMKDDKEPEPRAYDMKTRVVHTDSDGEWVNSLVLVDKGRTPVKSATTEVPEAPHPRDLLAMLGLPNQTLPIQYRMLTDTLPDGSYHWLFRLPAGVDLASLKQSVNNANGLAGVDVKTGNQLIYIKAGKVLRGDTIPQLAALPEAPAILLGWITKPKHEPKVIAPMVSSAETSRYGERALTSACEAIVSAPMGSRNWSLVERSATPTLSVSCLLLAWRLANRYRRSRRLLPVRTRRGYRSHAKPRLKVSCWPIRRAAKKQVLCWRLMLFLCALSRTTRR